MLINILFALIFAACSNADKVTGITKGGYSLDFETNNYTIKTLTIDRITVNYRAYENIVYVSNPVDIKYQVMNFYVPESYYEGKSINGYTLETAPIFLPNRVGGYMPAEPGKVGEGFGGTQSAEASFIALYNGIVVATPGIRGRTLQDNQGKYTGKAPAAIIDYKAAVRYFSL